MKKTGKVDLVMPGLTTKFDENVEQLSQEQHEAMVEEQVRLGLNLAGILFKKIEEATSAVQLSPVSVMVGLRAVEKMLLMGVEEKYRQACIDEANQVASGLRMSISTVKGPKNDRPN